MAATQAPNSLAPQNQSKKFAHWVDFLGKLLSVIFRPEPPPLLTFTTLHSYLFTFVNPCSKSVFISGKCWIHDDKFILLEDGFLSAILLYKSKCGDIGIQFPKTAGFCLNNENIEGKIDISKFWGRYGEIIREYTVYNIYPHLPGFVAINQLILITLPNCGLWIKTIHIVIRFVYTHQHGAHIMC